MSLSLALKVHIISSTCSDSHIRINGAKVGYLGVQATEFSTRSQRLSLVHQLRLFNVPYTRELDVFTSR